MLIVQIIRNWKSGNKKNGKAIFILHGAFINGLKYLPLFLKGKKEKNQNYFSQMKSSLRTSLVVDQESIFVYEQDFILVTESSICKVASAKSF